ncbi:MAG TPA: ABC transporter ATP-binding protein [bacterium]|nr:ABC transporter ATP-binding protein [bacterium]HOL47600.1 ABC transporter ATP-binding protein [bacterium]HPQ18717.1 ABC transporter ATP-binding protein [bacterium]
MKTIIELKNIDVGYSDNIVLKDVNLKIYENDFLGIIGANGSGKTTLIKLILGLIKPFKGEIKFYIDINFGYVPQLNMFDRKFPISVLDVVLSGLIRKKRIFKKWAKEDIEKAENLLNKFNILNLRNKPIGELSGGQLQRVLICRALISNCNVLILDEPDTYIDKEFEFTIYEIMKELNKTTAIILVSHDIGIIPIYIKNIACINKTLFYHSSNEISDKIISEAYKCPVDLIAHGKFPHRILKEHIH